MLVPSPVAPETGRPVAIRRRGWLRQCALLLLGVLSLTGLWYASDLTTSCITTCLRLAARLQGVLLLRVLMSSAATHTLWCQ